MLQLKSPRDTQVIGVHVATDTVVTKGQLLIQLDASRDAKYIARLDESAAKAKAHLNAISDNYLKERVAFMQSELEANGKAYCRSLEFEKIGREEILVGQRTFDDLIEVELTEMLNPTSEALLQTAVARDKLLKDVEIARRYISATLTLIEKERNYAMRRLERSSIKAPIDGRIRLFIGNHTPVKRGYVLAELR
jgi:multidrug resistance efflux pump